MKSSSDRPSRQDVLDAYAVEAKGGRETLERYLYDFPEYAEDLVDLSRELSRPTLEHERPLSAKEAAMVARTWQSFVNSANVRNDPFEALSATELRKIARRLDLPRQIIAAFRERRVLVESVPRRVFISFASAMNTNVEKLMNALALPQARELMRSYKSEKKPEPANRVTFEQLLTEAGVSEKKRAMLMTGDD